jgi:3'(2'), 5'-bisphosphate nucleotidase
MRQIDIPRLTPQLLQLARSAGEAIGRIYADAATATDVLYKSDASPLTAADLAAHDVICAGLRVLTPGLPVVSEEDADSPRQCRPEGLFWLVDPLDGTREFIARNGEFTVNIALIGDAMPLWGVVYAPMLDAMYWGGASVGAFRQCGAQVDAIRVAPAHAGALRVVASKSHLNEETSAFIRRLGSVELVQAGSSLKFCRVAEGVADLYPRLAPTCEWDTAAAQAVVEGAGGYVTDLQGAPLRYGKANVLNPHFVSAAMPLSALGLAC